MAARFAILILGFFSLYGVLIFHVYGIQVLGNAEFVVSAGYDYPAAIFSKANRGIIKFTDKNGKEMPVVLNKDLRTIYAVPDAIEDVLEAANILSPILGTPVEELTAMFSKEGDKYELLAKKVDGELVHAVEEAGVAGVYVGSEPGRFYQFGPAASHVIGFAGPSDDSFFDVGRYGMESFYESSLKAKVIEDEDGGGFLPGEDLVLTIDINIQIESEKILSRLVEEYEAKGGSVIVVDPKTGKVLAMASLPNFDPNEYGKYKTANFLNPAVQHIYEPGSVFKVITMAVGIDAGKITPDTVYYDKGTLTINGRTISNYDLKTNGPYGRATMTDVIMHSINTGAVFAEQQIGREIFTDYLHNFGFAEKTGVDLPGEVGGDLRRLSPKERDIAFATASYGQGVAVTPMGMINAFAAIANGGRLMRPYANSEMEPKFIRRVIGPETARQTAEMMVAAVDGAKVAQIKGYAVAGKTGTAFVPDFEKGGYTENVINTYIGFAPACTEGAPGCEPKFTALIKLDEPYGAPVAALTVVPAFRDLAQFILNYYGVEPDRL